VPDPTPARPAADRNLLFGVLALQMDFVTRDGLIAAMNAWVLDKAKPLGQVLREQGALRADAHALLEGLVCMHLKLHDNDPQKSLAAVSSIGSLREQIRQVGDAEVQASLARVATAHDAGADPFVTRPPSVGTPTSAGQRFHILRPHARGGLGEVFVAHDAELRREVALKEIQDRHADDPASRSRFLLEAEITGGLEHPGVVPVYGLGTYADGRPFYAMRFIRGDSLKDAIQRFHKADVPGRDPGARSLALRQLLGRFVDVCEAVAYAHSRGVLHRDLKPGNVMLGPYGETLVVDWGLAKPVGHPAGGEGATQGPLQPASASSSAPTQMGSVLGTPAFMPPEQAAGRLDQLGAASDVYSLGATLYCLLTGKAPFEGKDAGAVLQQVQRGELVPPRQVKPGVPAALEAVCLKAMALRPEDRYPTPLGLKADVESWLADEPVSAYREPVGQRLGRWGRRHKPLLAGAAALLLTGVAALGVGLVAVSAEQRKTAAALRAEKVAREEEGRRRDTTRRALDAMSSRVIEDWLYKQPELTGPQRKFLEQALAWYQDFADDTGGDETTRAAAAAACLRVGTIHYRLGHAREAEAAYRRGQDMHSRLAEEFPANPDYPKSLSWGQNNLATLLKETGRAREAEVVFGQALALRRRLADDFPDRPEFRADLAATYNSLGILLKSTGRPKEAEGAYREALALRRRLADDFPDRPDYRSELARSHNNLGNLFADTGRPKEAEEAHRKALALRRRLADDFPDRPEFRADLAQSHNNLGEWFRKAGRAKEAEAAYREAIVLQHGLAAEFPSWPDYRRTLAGGHNNLGLLLADTGRPKEAEPEYREALALQQRLAAEFPKRPAYRRELAVTYLNLASLLSDTGRPKEAEAAYREALALYKRLTADFPKVPVYQCELAVTLSNLAADLLKRHEPVAALPLLEEALPHCEAVLQTNPRHPFYRTVARDVAENSAEAFVQLRNHAEAARAAHRLGQTAVEPPKDFSNAARFLCRCVALVEKDTNLPDARRQELARQYGDRALAMLRQAVAKGYKDLAGMQKDKDLEPLRSRQDFQKLLRELQK
jgi:serine/threonine-protein kinase